jgi:hypothetical protein
MNPLKTTTTIATLETNSQITKGKQTKNTWRDL